MAANATAQRPCASPRSASRNPLPRSPIRFRFGTSTSSNDSSASGVARLPIFSSARASNGDSRRSTISPVGPTSRSFAMTRPTSATVPFVMSVLVPRSRKPSPVSSATSSTPDASEPTFGSVSPKNAISAPPVSPGR
jgi:hypothetical protein